MCQPKWKKKIVESGDVIEEIIYLEKPIAIKESNPKSKADKDRENLRRRIRDLGRIINANYSAGDYLITLTYNRESYSNIKASPSIRKHRREIAYASAEKELHLFMKRCQYHAQQLGIPFKAIYITSDMRGKSENYARVHHHLIVNREAIDMVRKLWTNGIVQKRCLRDQADYTAVAAYFVEQVRYDENKKTYAHTNNLMHPIISDVELKYADEELSVPEDATVLSASRNQIKYTFKK